MWRGQRLIELIFTLFLKKKHIMLSCSATERSVILYTLVVNTDIYKELDSDKEV